MYHKVQVAGRFCHNCHMMGKVDQKVQVVDHNRHFLHKLQVLEQSFNEILRKNGRHQEEISKLNDL